MRHLTRRGDGEPSSVCSMFVTVCSVFTSIGNCLNCSICCSTNCCALILGIPATSKIRFFQDIVHSLVHRELAGFQLIEQKLPVNWRKTRRKYQRVRHQQWLIVLFIQLWHSSICLINNMLSLQGPHFPLPASIKRKWQSSPPTIISHFWISKAAKRVLAVANPSRHAKKIARM